MSVSPSRPARVVSRALLGLVLAAPAGVLAVPSASAAPRVDVEPLAEACGVRLSFSGRPAGTSTVHLDLVALDPERTLALTPPGPREVDGGGRSSEDVLAEGLDGATATQAYRATVTVDGEVQPAVELALPECADPAASPSPSATASPSPSGTATASPSVTPTGTASPTATASPSATATPTGTAGPATATPSASAPTPTATTSPAPSDAPVVGPRAVSAPSSSGVIALSGAVAAAPIGALPLPAAAPAPVVAPPTGGVAAAVAAPPPLAAALPALPGQPAPLAPAPQAAAPEVAAPQVLPEPAAADGTWTAGLPAALLVGGAAAGALGLRLRRRTQNA